METTTGPMIPEGQEGMAPPPKDSFPSGDIPTKNVVKMQAVGMLPDKLGRALETLKTGPIENLPCGNCQNFVTTVPVEAKFPITSLPPCLWFNLWIANRKDCWYKRLEHLCPNCGVILMICTKPIVKKVKIAHFKVF